ncbi:MAG: DUF1489 domain-containing protein [Rhodobacteraceae bacterium]|nr:DUF1489 domain-containing protein [Paracoccaceae bacterium]
MAEHVNLIKLCVGADAVEDLATWQARRRAEAEARGEAFRPVHVTRMWPRRAAEVLDGGSLYWVFKGQVLARQQIVALEPREGADGITRCAIVMQDAIIRTQAVPRRPFQGWRYLNAADAPPDLALNRAEDDDLPLEMRLALADIGLR